MAIPFLRDFDAHARFLVALPLLIAAEWLVHQRTRTVLENFTKRGIVRPEDLGGFHEAIASAMRLRDSIAIEVALLLVVFTVGTWHWLTGIAMAAPTWYGTADSGHWRLTPAGYWYAAVSIPTFQFILARWYVRLVIWWWLLWRLSRLPLRITCTHPDRAGGLGFLGKSAYAFSPLLFAQGVLLSGVIANRVVYASANLTSFRLQAVGLIAFFVVVILAPLTVFTPRLAQRRRAALGQYGLLAMNYVRAFEEKWVDGTASEQGELLGTADIQSLADLGNSYNLVRDMRVIPFSLSDMTQLAVATAAPLAPLALLIVPLDELVVHLLKILF